MLISVSKSASDNDAHQTDFDAVVVNSMRDLARIAMGPRHWSPIVWRSGKRSGVNYESVSFLVLDFDDGKKEAAELAHELRAESVRFLIMATRSHRLEKNGVVCDRFRVVIPFASPILCADTYRQNMRRLLSGFPCDQACADAARKYRPSTALLAFGDGDPIPWLPFEPPPPPNANMRMMHRIMRSRKELPLWVAQALASDTPGSRNQTLFRVAAKLTEYGYSEQEVISVIHSSAASIPQKEKEDVARSGIRSARPQT